MLHEPEMNHSQQMQRLATALEGPSAVNRGTEPQSDVVEESGVPRVWFLQGMPVESRQIL
jgi:hypothetical protein